MKPSAAIETIAMDHELNMNKDRILLSFREDLFWHLFRPDSNSRENKALSSDEAVKESIKVSNELFARSSF